jgi:hypothetical protein
MGYQKDSRNEDKCSRNKKCLGFPVGTQLIKLRLDKTENNEIRNRMKVTGMHRKIQEKRLR